MLIIQINLGESVSQVTLMLDSGSGPNLVKEKFLPKNATVNYTKILQLSGINEYPVYTLGEVYFIPFGKTSNLPRSIQ